MDYLNLPFNQFDTEYLESLPDEVFFAHRYKMSEEDEALLLANSRLIHGKRFYKAKIREPLVEKYAAMTNPKEGEPGTKTNPLVRFGQEYVYTITGDLVPYRRGINIKLIADLTADQKEMIREAAKKPITYEPDCPKSSNERLQRFRAYGQKRNQERIAAGQ